MNGFERADYNSETYSNQVFAELKRWDPCTFVPVDYIAARLLNIPSEYDANQIVIGAIQNLRKHELPRTSEAIISIFGSNGYMWMPTLTIGLAVKPYGYRPDMHYQTPQIYHQSLAIVWNAMREVDIVDDKTARLQVDESVYKDMKFFAQRIGQNISVSSYAHELDRTITTAHSRILKMAQFLETVPESGLRVYTSYGYGEYRIDFA